jgi:hypothetical protein
MKLYALYTLHEVSFFHLVTSFLAHFLSFQTGWGTRAGIGDAAAATAALDRQAEEKNNHINNPYQRQSRHSSDTAGSPFKDLPPSPYHDEPTHTPAQRDDRITHEYLVSLGITYYFTSFVMDYFIFLGSTFRLVNPFFHAITRVITES